MEEYKVPILLKNYDKNSQLNQCVDHENINNQDISGNSFKCELNGDKNQPNEREVRRSFLKRGEGLRQRFKMDPDKFRLYNLPRYTFTKAKQSSAPLASKINRDLKKKKISFNEQYYSKKNAFNDNGTKQQPIYLPAVTDLKISNDLKASPEAHLPLSWAQVLHSEKSPGNFDENLSLFELIEQKIKESEIKKKPSIALNPLISNIPVNEYLQKSGLRPTIGTISIGESNACENENEELLKEKQLEYSHENSNFEYESTDSVLSNKDDNVALKDDDDRKNSSFFQVFNDKSSSFQDILLFEHFKQSLFMALQNRENEQVNMIEDDKRLSITILENELVSNNISNSNNKDIKNYSKELKIRIAELEEAICIFKKNNLELIEARQQFEIDKIQSNQKYEDMIEKLKDERLQFEINMHDQHMKIEKEKQKIEQQLRLQKTHSKDCTISWKNEIAELKEQLKQKEINHCTAQTRLRIHVRNLEKEQRQLTEKVTQLTKDNKKLQVENMLITRERNNKMLQEINRNIARLAPTPQCESQIKFTQKAIKIKKHDLKQTCNVEWEISQKPKLLEFETKEHTNKCINPYHEVDKNGCILPQNKNTLSEQYSSSTREFKREIINKDGSKDIWYPNGNLKKISSDGMKICMLYFNKDVKETNINDGMVKYYYADSNIWHTTYLDGLEILEFPNGQTEQRHKNGIVEVHFPNDSIRIMNPNDEELLEEWRFADGTNLMKKRNGEQILILPNGQKEVHTKMFKRREYPDGTVKLVYPDGSQESRYSNGRIRLKDKSGNLIMDNAT